VLDNNLEQLHTLATLALQKKSHKKNSAPIQNKTLNGRMVYSSYFTDSVVTATFIIPTDLLATAVIAGNHTCQLYEHRY
jgi:hypothetical protein